MEVDSKMLKINQLLGFKFTGNLLQLKSLERLHEQDIDCQN